MTLSAYIRKIGTAAFAKRFGVSERTAVAYMYGDRRPRPELAQRLVDETPVSWDGVYAGKAEIEVRTA